MSDDRLFGRDFKVLVADDSATTRLTIAREFIGPGVEIIQARDGLEALEKAKSQAPNIITLDIMMPGLDGYEVCEELMMYDSTMDIPIVMISSRSNEDERYRSLEAGALEYYIKPFEVGALRKFVFKLLKQVGINQNKVIFCLDRRRAIRAMVQGFLQDAGYQVRLFRSAQEVQSALAAEEECDLLLLDFELPNAGGLKLLDWVRSQRIHDFLPVIAMTASGERKDLAIAFRRGGNDYLRKPFFPEELLARIENQLQLGRVKEQLQRGAIFDPLTGLPNRSGLKRALAIELARALRDGHGLGIIVFDIDHFKRVNDSYGHLIGDDVLRVVGERMTESLRLTDIVARYGGEEFVVVAPCTSSELTVLLSERIRQAVAASKVKTRRQEVAVTISAGACFWPHEKLGRDKTLDQLMANADEALYKAKNSGRNQTCLATQCEEQELSSSS